MSTLLMSVYMSVFRPATKRTVARVRSQPWLLLGSLPLVVMLTLPVVFTLLVDRTFMGPLLFFCWCVVAWLLVSPLTTAVLGYVTVATEKDSGFPPGELVNGLRQYPRLLARTIVIRLVAVPLLVFALGIAGGIGLATLTGVQAVGYALGAWTFSRELLTLLNILLIVLVLVVAEAPVLFVNAETLRERSLSKAALASAKAFKARPLSVTILALIEVTLGLLPFIFALLVSFAIEKVGGLPVQVGLILLTVVFAVTGIPLFCGRAVFHEEALQKMRTNSSTPRPVVSRVRPVSAGRVVLLGLLLVGVIYGGIAIRIADERPGSQFANAAEPVPTDADIDADALLKRSFDRTRRVSHESRDRWYNRSTGRMVDLTVQRVEYPDSQFEVYFLGRSDEDVRTWKSIGTYMSPTTIAPFQYTEITTDGRPPNVTTLRRDQEPMLNVVNPYPISSVQPEEMYSQLLPRLKHGDWHIVSESESRVVLGVTNYSSVARREPQYIKNGSVQVVIDRDTGYVTRIEEEWTLGAGNATERRYRVMTFQPYETDTVTRPPALGPQTPLQLLFDVLYY